MHETCLAIVPATDMNDYSSKRCLYHLNLGNTEYLGVDEYPRTVYYCCGEEFSMITKDKC